MAIIGIDLGTTNSLAAYWKDGQVHLIPDKNGNCLIPSVVGCVRTGEKREILVGREAKELVSSREGEVVLSFKRFMGTEKTYVLGEDSYTPMELSAMLLRKIKGYAEDFLGEQIEEAIITVPAYFNDKQRSDTKKAAQIAGLKADRLINEPSAAALAYQTGRGQEEKSLLVFDFGGGTLDLSYVECFDNVIEIIAVAGDNALGGDDIDGLMAEYFCTQNRLDWEKLAPEMKNKLLGEMEAAKKKLGTGQSVLAELTIEGVSCRAEFDEDRLFDLCMPLFMKIKALFLHVLEDAGHSIADLDDLIMVGGSSRLPVVKRFLTELLGKEPVVVGNTDLVVAMGAGVYAGIRGRKEEIRDILLTDVCPFTLGVESFRRQGDKRGYLLPMIERNSTLPAFRSERLVTLYDYQSRVTVKIYQGEEYYAKDNIYLGEVSVKVEPKKAGKEWIDVSFSYDINGILHVEVVNSRQERSRILLANQELSPAEVERYKQALEALTAPPEEQEKNRRLLKKAEEYYEKSSGERKQWIGSLIGWFLAGINSNRRYKVKKAVEEMERYLALLEEEDGHKEEWLFNGELKEEWDQEKEDE